MIKLPLLGGNWIEPHGGEEWSIGGLDQAVFCRNSLVRQELVKCEQPLSVPQFTLYSSVTVLLNYSLGNDIFTVIRPRCVLKKTHYQSCLYKCERMTQRVNNVSFI